MSLFKKLKMLFKGRKVLKEAMKQKGLVQEVYEKASWKSSEFWMAALTGIGAIAAQAGGLVPEPYGPVIMAVSVVFYTLSRGLAKHADPLGGLKSNAATTEFWATAATNVGVMISSISNTVEPQTAAALMCAANVAYGVSRGLAKGGAQPE